MRRRAATRLIRPQRFPTLLQPRDDLCCSARGQQLHQSLQNPSYPALILGSKQSITTAATLPIAFAFSSPNPVAHVINIDALNFVLLFHLHNPYCTQRLTPSFIVIDSFPFPISATSACPRLRSRLAQPHLAMQQRCSSIAALPATVAIIPEISPSGANLRKQYRKTPPRSKIGHEESGD